MGCSVRFAGRPGRSNERRIEWLARKYPPRAAQAEEKPHWVDDKGAAKMIDDKKISDEGLSAAAAEGSMVIPTPELPDDTQIERVLFSTRIQNALRAADLKTVGQVREMSDETLISLPDLGKGSLAVLRENLGLPSSDGVRPVSKKPS
jgi:DNA-directed RNA polymerase alpha subunit